MFRCKKCAFEFSSGKKKDAKKSKPSAKTPTILPGTKLAERRESDDAGGSMPKTPSTDQLQEVSAFAEEVKDFEQGIEEPNVARTLFDANIASDDKYELR